MQSSVRPPELPERHKLAEIIGHRERSLFELDEWIRESLGGRLKTNVSLVIDEDVEVCPYPENQARKAKEPLVITHYFLVLVTHADEATVAACLLEELTAMHAQRRAWSLTHQPPERPPRSRGTPNVVPDPITAVVIRPTFDPQDDHVVLHWQGVFAKALEPFNLSEAAK